MKSRVLDRHKNRINGEGELVLTCSTQRTQEQNRSEAGLGVFFCESCFLCSFKNEIFFSCNLTVAKLRQLLIEACVEEFDRIETKGSLK